MSAQQPSNNAAQTATTGGRLLVSALAAHGTDTVFAVPGESYLEVLDALYDRPSIRVVTCRHEGAAANMAEADGKLTGRPGICMVTRGPGATHAAVGVHTAMQDSTPMILLIGQVARPVSGREAFQEIDYRQMFAPIAKWTAEIDSAERVPEFMARAFQVATAGRQGPVVLALPEDMLVETAHVPACPPYRRVLSAPMPEDMLRLREALGRANRPMVIVGGSGWTEAACADLAAFAEAFALPFCASFRRQDLFDNRSALYAGHLGFGLNPKLGERLGQADLLIAIGPRLGEVSSNGYSLFTAPVTRQKLVHIHADPEELGRVFAADIAMAASMPGIAQALRHLPSLSDPVWRDWTAAARRDFVEFTRQPTTRISRQGVALAEVIAGLSQTLPDDAILCNGAGNYAVWVHRFYRYRQPRTELAPTSGAMGYGLPAAIAAKIRYPQRVVICFAGDGCFMMYPQELATAVQQGAGIIVLVVNNGMYGTIRMHQERDYPGRVIATQLGGADFAALARALGAYGETVHSTEDFPAAFARAQAAGGPALLDLRTDPAQITPMARLPV